MKFGKKKSNTQPKVPMYTQKDIDDGLERAFSGARKSRQQNYQPFVQKQQKRKSKLSFEIPTPEPEPVQEQPYWSGEEWEKWAFSIYQHYQQYRKFLPEWFIDAVEEELKQRRR